MKLSDYINPADLERLQQVAGGQTVYVPVASRKWEDELARRISALVERGLTDREIGQEMGRTRQWVGWMRRKMGMARRPVGRPRRDRAETPE